MNIYNASQPYSRKFTTVSFIDEVTGRLYSNETYNPDVHDKYEVGQEKGFGGENAKITNVVRDETSKIILVYCRNMNPEVYEGRRLGSTRETV